MKKILTTVAASAALTFLPVAAVSAGSYDHGNNYNHQYKSQHGKDHGKGHGKNYGGGYGNRGSLNSQYNNFLTNWNDVSYTNSELNYYEYMQVTYVKALTSSDTTYNSSNGNVEVNNANLSITH